MSDQGMSAEEVRAAIARRRHRAEQESRPPCICSHPYHKDKECLVSVRGYFCNCERYEAQGEK